MHSLTKIREQQNREFKAAGKEPLMTDLEMGQQIIATGGVSAMIAQMQPRVLAEVKENGEQVWREPTYGDMRRIRHDLERLEKIARKAG